MGKRARAGVLIAGVALIGAGGACSLFVSLDGLDDGPSVASDGGGGDALGSVETRIIIREGEKHRIIPITLSAPVATTVAPKDAPPSKADEPRRSSPSPSWEARPWSPSASPSSSGSAPRATPTT